MTDYAHAARLTKASALVVACQDLKVTADALADMITKGYSEALGILVAYAKVRTPSEETWTMVVQMLRGAESVALEADCYDFLGDLPKGPR